MRGFIAFPAPLLPSHLLSATSQDGARITKLVPSKDNAGNVALKSLGALEAASNPTVVFTTGGALADAKYKFSHDGGTNWYGRYNGLFTNGNPLINADGSYALVLESGGGYTWDSVTNPIYVDTNGDGIPDIALCAAADSTAKVALLFQTTDMSGSPSAQWTGRVLFGGGRNLIRVGSLVARNNLICVTAFHDSGSYHYIQLWRTSDYGATWADTRIHKESGTIIPDDAIPRACLCQSGVFAIVYPYTDSGKVGISMRTTFNGVDLSNRVAVHTQGVHNMAWPTIFQNYDGITLVFYKDTEDQVLKCAASGDWDPGNGSFGACGTYTMTTFDSSANIGHHNAMMAPDGTVYIFAVDNSGDDKVIFTKLKGAGTFPAPTDALAVTGKNFAMPACGMIGGSLWLMSLNLTESHIQMQQTMYPVALEVDAEGDAENPSWCGREINGFWQHLDYSLHYVGNGLWLKFSGATAGAGDAWTGDTFYTYGAHRMLMYRPKYPARSTADGVEWESIFDLSAYHPLAFNSIFVRGNVASVTVQGNDTNSWGSPSFSAAISCVTETIASDKWTAATYAVTRQDGGAFIPHFYRGLHAVIGTGRAIRIIDNDATTLYLAQSAAGQSGSLKIVTGRGWAKNSTTFKKYLRLVIAPQYTETGKYEIANLIIAQWSDLSPAQRISTWELRVPVEDYETPGGSIIRYPLTSERRIAGRLSILAPTHDQFRELGSQFSALEGRPIAYAKDRDNAAWWDLMLPSPAIAWNPRKTDIDLVEVI